MHKTLKRFGMEGEVRDDADFSRLRAQYETLITHSMRAEGYVPIIGLGPFWSTVYNKEKGSYDFTLSLHGLHVGRKKSSLIQGITAEGRIITAHNK